MNDNFDCTQFITFSYEGTGNIDRIIRNTFRGSVFNVIRSDEMRPVKKRYFKHYLEEFFFELAYDEFMGEFEDWDNENKPTPLLELFTEKLKGLFLLHPIKKAKIILVNFAEEGKTNDEFVYIERSEIYSGLFKMSRHNFGSWSDTLILELSD